MIINRYSDINKEDTSLRPYQQKAKKEIFESWDEVDNVMFQMPTGTGKTRLFTSIIRDINDYSKQRKEPVKILIIAHRTELIDQIDESLRRYQVAHNVIAGGRDRNYKFPVNVASIQTITHPNNLKDAKKLDVQFVIIDEAHHALAATYKKLWKLYPESKKLGVTATPWRMNHQSFLDLFDKLVLSMPIKDFIKQGYLSSYKYFSLRSDSDIQRTIDDIELDRFGEYKESSMEERMDIGSIRAQLLDSYLSLAEGKKGIIYAINIVHAKHICEEYKKAGYTAVSIDSKTPASERKELVGKFRRGLIDIIVNVDIFSEGFDCPDIEFIQLARPTRSLVKYLQQVGRGLRPTENKQECIILDNVGMYSRFGLPNARRHWRQHFLGKDIEEVPKIGISKGTGRSRIVDMSEGTEDMELIQDAYEEVDTVADENNEIIHNEPSDFNPIDLLVSNHFEIDNFIFYFKKSKKIYESYIQDDQYFIISELIIDEANHCVHRNRVGKISNNSWMFYQFLRQKIDNLKSIEHYKANYTLFHYNVMSSDKTWKDKYFDYKGREVDSSEVVKVKYEEAVCEQELKDYVDIPVSKASFKIELDDDSFTIYRTVKGTTKLISEMRLTSDFGNSYFLTLELDNIDRREKGIPEIKPKNTDWIPVIRSDEKSFTIKEIAKGQGYLKKYDLDGKLLKTETIVGDTKSTVYTLSKNDLDKFLHVFDKKATSYKYFWFLSLLQIYKETQEGCISLSTILVRMVANAWEYVFVRNGRFTASDQIPFYLKEIKSIINLKANSTISDIEEKINQHPRRKYIYSLITPLLKNVPYRFLSPWIPFTSNDEVKEKSNHPETRCLYELHDDCIIISNLWRSFLLECYDDNRLFIKNSLISHLKTGQFIDNDTNLYNEKYVTLSALVKEIKMRKNNKSVASFLEKFNLPPNGKISPRDILEKIPESKFIVDKEGRKVLDVSKGMWSLKLLTELMSE